LRAAAHQPGARYTQVPVEPGYTGSAAMIQALVEGRFALAVISAAKRSRSSSNLADESVS
jgi:hypothetical protein